MSKLAFAFVVLAVSSSAAPVFADAPQEEGVVSDYQRVPQFKDDKLVCKKVAQTGTRITREVCKTKSQRDAERTGAQNFLDDFTRNAAIQKQKAS